MSDDLRAQLDVATAKLAAYVEAYKIREELHVAELECGLKFDRVRAALAKFDTYAKRTITDAAVSELIRSIRAAVEEP